MQKIQNIKTETMQTKKQNILFFQKNSSSSYKIYQLTDTAQCSPSL